MGEFNKGNYGKVSSRVKESGNNTTKKDQDISNDPDFLTNTPEMEKLLRTIKKFALSEAPVLITGESGVGKEVVARLIHKYSERSDESFVAINSGAIPGDLIESELFGHEKGAFTGATSQKEGCFELADKGTLFLDEIGDMPSPAQVKVLRAVEQNTFRRVGGKKEVSVDVRIVSATNKILMEKVLDKSFREDLFHRINVLELYIPPLQTPAKDITLFLNHFLDIFSQKYKFGEASFSDEVLEIFQEYKWPGNVRELKNIVERCVILSSGEEITPSILPERFFKDNGTELPSSKREEEEDNDFIKIPLGATMEQVERAVIKQTLSLVGYNKTQAAKILGVTRKTLHKKVTDEK
ncbi:MAG: sigma-54 dependent transcriptional regulator [Balneolaceae bacterium]|nr:sigma-54 dependent transcriptional regulator [Balneolaceae bacterium]